MGEIKTPNLPTDFESDDIGEIHVCRECDKLIGIDGYGLDRLSEFYEIPLKIIFIPLRCATCDKKKLVYDRNIGSYRREKVYRKRTEDLTDIKFE